MPIIGSSLGLGNAGLLAAGGASHNVGLFQSFLGQAVSQVIASDRATEVVEGLLSQPNHGTLLQESGIQAESSEDILEQIAGSTEYARRALDNRELLEGIIASFVTQGQVELGDEFAVLLNPVTAGVHFTAAELGGIYSPVAGTDAGARYAQPLSHAIQTETATLRNALSEATTATQRLMDARHVDATQAAAINAVWTSMARLDRLLNVDVVQKPARLGEIDELQKATEAYLSDLGLQPMSQLALEMREGNYRFMLQAPGQANEYIGLFKQVYGRSDVARRFVDEIVIPALRSEGIDVNEYLDMDPAQLSLEQNKAVLNSSRISQPMILATQLALLEELKSYGFDPQFFTAGSGHSQGLLLASVAAGKTGPAEALRIVAIHGREMQNGTKAANTKVPMVSVLGISRMEAARMSNEINLHLALVNGIPGETAPLNPSQLRELKEKADSDMLYGRLFPVEKMAQDPALRAAYPFFARYFNRDFHLTDEEIRKLGLPRGLNESAAFIIRGDMETTYTALINMEPSDGSRTRGVMPAFIFSGTHQAQELVLGLLGNKQAGTEPHPAFRNVGYNFNKKEETTFPKTAVLITSSPFHHAGEQRAAFEKSVARADETRGEATFPVVLNSEPASFAELGLTPQQEAQRITAEQHVRHVDWPATVEKMLTFGDQTKPAVFVSMGDGVVAGFTAATTAGRATTIAAANKDGSGFAQLTSRKSAGLRLRTAPLADRSIYEPIEAQVLAGRPNVDGQYLGPIGYLSSVTLGNDKQRLDLIRRIRKVVDFSDPMHPKFNNDEILARLGAEGPYGVAAMTGPGTSKLIGAVARAGRTAYLAAGNYPGKAHLNISIKQGFITGLIDTAWETTRSADPATGELDAGSLTYGGEPVVRGSIETYSDRAQTDGQYLGEARFEGPMKSFGVNLMHAAGGGVFSKAQCDATAEMIDRGLPIDKISVGIYLIQDNAELRRYIPLLARGVRFAPLLPNMNAIRIYQDEHIPYLKEELKKYLEGGWRTFNADNPGYYESDAIHSRFAAAHPEYFGKGGYDRFMADHPDLLMKMREGNDGGGHNSPEGTPTYRLVQDAVVNPKNEKTKNISTGGYSFGVAVADALLSGAAGVQAGSVFEITQEADLPYKVKALIMEVADPDSPREATNIVSEFGKPLNVAVNAFSQAYVDLVATDDAEEILDILAREPVDSVRFHREFWNNGIETEDPALNFVMKNEAVFEPIWDFLVGDRQSGRQAALDAIRKLNAEDEKRCHANFLKKHKDESTRPAWNPTEGNDKAQLITFYRVFRTNMIQSGEVDPEWAYVLVGRSITRMPQQFLERFKADGTLPTVSEFINTIESDALSYLTQLMGRALTVQAQRAQAYELQSFDPVPNVQIFRQASEEGQQTLRVRPLGAMSEDALASFRRAAKAQGYGHVAEVLRQGSEFNRFFTPRAGREFYFDLQATDGQSPQLVAVRILQDGKEIARVESPSATEVTMSYEVPRDAYGELEPRTLTYQYNLQEPVPGVHEWRLDRERVQRESTAIFGELLTGTQLDYTGRTISDTYTDQRPVSEERVREYARIVGEGYDVFHREGVVHPGLVGVESLRSAVLASNHPDFQTDRFQLLHAFFNQSFGTSASVGSDVQVASRNTEATGLDNGGFSQDARIVTRNAAGDVVSEVDTGFVNLDPRSRFTPLSESIDPELADPATAETLTGFAAYPIWQPERVVKVTRQDILDYTMFDPNAIHHADFVAQMAGLDDGIIAQGMLVHGKMVSHMLGGYLQGDLDRAVSVKTTFTGKVLPGEDLDLVAYRIGQQGEYDILRFDATNADGNTVVTQEWKVRRNGQIVAFPGQGFQKAGMWTSVTNRYQAPQDAKPELKAAYERAQQAQRTFLKQVDQHSLERWGFRLSDVVKHAPKTLSFNVSEDYAGESYRGRSKGERLTVRNASQNGILSETDFTQPALFVAYVLDWIGMRELGKIHPDADIVYNSLGKIAALVAVGAISPVDGLQLARARGVFMGEVKGAFGVASIKGKNGLWDVVEREAQKVRDELGPDYNVHATNQNSTRQVGFAGTEKGVEALVHRLSDLGIDGLKTRRLNAIENPFHTDAYADAAERMYQYLQGLEIDTSRLHHMILNHTGERFAPGDQDIRRALANHIMMPIRVADGLETAIRANPSAELLELGHVTELTKRAAETVDDRGLNHTGASHSAADSFAALTYAEPDDKIEVEQRAVRLTSATPQAAPAAAPAAQAAAAAPAAAVAAPVASAAVSGKYIEPPAAGTPEHTALQQDVRVSSAMLLTVMPGAYNNMRSGALAPDDADLVAAGTNALVTLGPGAIEGLQTELKHREDARDRSTGADKKIQEFIVTALNAAIERLKAARKELEASKGGGGGGVDVDSPEFRSGVAQVMDAEAEKLGFVRTSAEQLSDASSYIAEVGSDGTLYQPGGVKQVQAQAIADEIATNTSKRFVRMMTGSYNGIRFHMDQIQHNGAETNLFNLARELRVADNAGTLANMSQAAIARRRRRLANQLDADGAARAEALADLAESQGYGAAAEVLRGVAAETRESLQVGGLPPLHHFEITDFDPLYGTTQMGRDVSRDMSPEESLQYLKANQLIDPELADRILDFVTGKVSLRGERVLVMGSGTISTPLIGFLLEQGAHVIMTTTRQRERVNQEVHDLFQEYASREARLEVKTEFGFNPTNYVKLRDEMRLDGFAPTLFLNGAGLGDYGAFADVSTEDWHAVSEALVRAPLYMTRLLANWYLQEQNGVTYTYMELASPAAARPLPGSGSYRAAKNALDNFGWVDHVVASEGMRHADGTPVARQKQLVVGWVNAPADASGKLMSEMRNNSMAVVDRAREETNVLLHIFNGQTMASGALGVLHPAHRGQSERLEALGNFDHPQLEENGRLAQIMDAVNKAEKEKHDQAKRQNGNKPLSVAASLRHAGRTEEADRLEAAQREAREVAEAHPFQHGLLFRVWDMPFYIRDAANDVDTFDANRHVEASNDDLVAVGVAGTGPYGKTLIGNYRNPLERWGVTGDWGGADWQELTSTMPDIQAAMVKAIDGVDKPEDLTPEHFRAESPDGKPWSDRIFAQSGLRQLEHLARHRRLGSTVLSDDAWVPLSINNKEVIKRHSDAGHEIKVEEAYNAETGEYETRVYGRVPQGEDVFTWVIDSLNVSTLADLPGGTDNFFKAITGVSPNEMVIRSFATVLTRLTVSQLLRFMGMNATDIRREVTAAAINVVAGIGMVDFNPTDEMMLSAALRDKTEKDAIEKAIPNAVSNAKIHQLGAADSSTTTSEACATGPGALKIVEEQYLAAKALMDKTAAAVAAGHATEDQLFNVALDYYMKAYFAWSVDHAQGAANVQSFDALGDRGAMARDDFLAENGLPHHLALAAHNEYRDGFIAGVMIGGITFFPRLLADIVGARPIARMIGVTGSTDFNPQISGGSSSRADTAPGVEGQILSLIRLIDRLKQEGYSIDDIVAWFTHSTGTMGDDKQSEALREALELANAAEPGLAVEVFAKQIFGHGLGATMFEQAIALVFLHIGQTLGQPALSRTIAATAENPHMFPSRQPLDVFGAVGRSPRRGVVGTNFGFHGENRAWAMFADTTGYQSVGAAIAGQERRVLNEAQAIADTHANRDGAMDDITKYNTEHAPVSSHPHAQFMADHARTIAMMMVEQELTDRAFDFDSNLENEVLAYEARLRQQGQLPGRVTLGHKRALAAMGGADYQGPNAAVVNAHQSEQQVSNDAVRTAYQQWGEGFADVAETLGIDQDFVQGYLDQYARVMSQLNVARQIPRDWNYLAKSYLIKVGAKDAALLLQRTIADLTRRHGEDPVLSQAMALWVYQMAAQNRLNEVSWAQVRQLWANRQTAAAE